MILMAVQAALVEILKTILGDILTSEEPKELKAPEPDIPDDVILEEANKTLDLINREYPSFASTTKMEVMRGADGHINRVEFKNENKIMGWLEYGTGIYGPFRMPIKAKDGKVLHFEDATIAAALGFPTKDVFLASVKGIRPRFIFIRAIRDFAERLGWRMYSDRMESGVA